MVPRPRETPFSKDYAAWKNWNAEDFGKAGAEDRLYYAREVFARHPKPSPAVLEVGFGNGSFLACARERGCRVAGIEVNAELVATAAKAGFEVHGSLGDCSPGSFDIVVAFDVLEHIPEEAIVAFLAEVRDVLVENGIFIARFPNGDSPFARRLQHGDATHLTSIGSSKARWYARQAGLAVDYTGNPAHVYTGLGRARFVRRALAGIGRSLIESVLGHLYYGERAAFDPCLLIVLRRSSA